MARGSTNSSRAKKPSQPNKSRLQIRAEDCAQRFKSESRRPIVIEFAGLPKAGKTTTLGQVQAFLKRCGFRVEVVIERASVCPIKDKKHSNFNIWTACTTLAQILEHTQTPPRPDDPDILILDRGLFDSICWFSIMERLARVRPTDRVAVERFLMLEDWCKRIHGVILMTANPKDALKREKGFLPVVGSGGSIMNEQVLESMASALDEVCERVGSQFNIMRINTSAPAFSTPQKSCEAAASKVLDWIEAELREDVLTLPSTKVEKIFSKRPSIGADAAKELVKAFISQGKYIARSEVESDLSKVQALPIVVVRNKSGNVLRLKRREKTENNLHKRIVIWAGGHVRKEDKGNGDPLLHCAVRELEEELRLSIEIESLELKGAIHAKVDEGTTKHVALVYEWRAKTDEVEIALSNSEFFERMGNSLSGTFIDIDTLLNEQETGELGEEWSAQIVKNFVNETKGKAKRDLFDPPL